MSTKDYETPNEVDDGKPSVDNRRFSAEYNMDNGFSGYITGADEKTIQAWARSIKRQWKMEVEITQIADARV
jgi:hypothetical protein